MIHKMEEEMRQNNINIDFAISLHYSINLGIEIGIIHVRKLCIKDFKTKL